VAGPLFTGPVSNPTPSPDAAPSVPAAHAYWRGWTEVRADLRSGLGIALAFALAGAPAGLVWWWLAPRADFRITSDGAVPLGDPSSELLVADDVVLALVLAGLGLIGGTAVWFLRRRRGVGALLAIALGASAAGVVAWLVGELLGPGPTKAQLADVGARVTTSLTLGSAAVLAVAPFMALLAYLVAVLSSHDDSLGRPPVDAGRGPGADAPPPVPSPTEPRPLVEAPPGSPPV
jgi:LPXTG-motif cell wall-anchored protein